MFPTHPGKDEQSAETRVETEEKALRTKRRKRKHKKKALTSLKSGINTKRKMLIKVRNENAFSMERQMNN